MDLFLERIEDIYVQTNTCKYGDANKNDNSNIILQGETTLNFSYEILLKLELDLIKY